jgi:hypothetical protein
VVFDDADREKMCFKELATLVYELPDGYFDNNQSGIEKGRPCAPFPKLIGSKVLTKKPAWEKAYVGEVVARVGPRVLDNGERGAVYQAGSHVDE